MSKFKTLIETLWLPKKVNLVKNTDIIGIAFHVAVGGLVNKNGDAITVESAFNLADTLIYKPIDVEHDMSAIIGSIISAGVTDRETGAPISLEEAKTKKTANISVGGVIYADRLHPDILNFLIDCGNPNSSGFGTISASWELEFEDFDIGIGTGVLEEDTVISGAAKEPFLKHLYRYGGLGEVDGKKVYCIIKPDNARFVGVGLVLSPAADVKGIYTILNSQVDDNTSLDDRVVSQSSISSLKSVIFREDANNMKTIFDKIEDLYKNIDTLSKDNKTFAASIQTLVNDAIKDADENWKRQLQEKENSIAELTSQLAEVTKKVETLLGENETLKASVKSADDKIAELKQTLAAKEQNELFNTRMAYVSEKFSLSDEQREAVADMIRNVGNGDFETFVSRLEKLFAKQSHASTAAAPAPSVNDAIQTAQHSQAAPPNAVGGTETWRERFAKAFGPEVLIKR